MALSMMILADGSLFMIILAEPSPSMIGIVMSIVTLGSVFVYRVLIERTFNLDTGGSSYYTHHIAMVTESHADPFWKSVWYAAKQEGAKSDAVVEWVGNSLTEEYSKM